MTSPLRPLRSGRRWSLLARRCTLQRFIDGAEQWTTVGVMRYRSRRDIMEIAVKGRLRRPTGAQQAV